MADAFTPSPRSSSSWPSLAARMQASELLTEAIRYCHQGGDADAVDALLRVKTDLLARIRADYPRALVGERLYAVAEVLHIPVSDEVTPR